MIPEEKVREVAERLSIVDVVGEYVSLKRSGASYTGLCPFHGEKTPSFNVNPAKDFFHCYGCGAGGNIFSFVMKIEGLSFPEAFRKLAARAGVAVEERPLTAAEQQALKDRESQRSIMLLAAQRYRDILTKHPDGAAARNYLQHREVDHDTAGAYGLGCAPTRRDTLVQLLQEKGLSLDIAANLGVIRKADRGWYDLLHGRLIFPIRDAQGQPIGFAGRVLDDGLPKYINSPESPLYRKSSVLFGIDLALREIRLSRSVIVVEGYFDHLALYRAGIRNVLATCGTALTDGHIALLKKHSEQVFLLFDSDKAGRSATVRAMELCLEQRLPVYVISLPQGDDPDSFLQSHGAEAFQEKILSAKPAFMQFLHWLLTKTPPSSTDNKARLAREIAPRLAKISEVIERELYEKEVCRQLQIDDLSAFHRQVVKQTVKSTSNNSVSLQTVRKAENRDRIQEMLLGLMAKFEGARDEAQNIGCNTLFDDLHRPLAEALLKESQHDNTSIELWPSTLKHLHDPQQQELAVRLCMTDKSLYEMESWQGAFNDCIQKLDERRIKELKLFSTQLDILPQESLEFQEMLKKAEELRNRKSALQ